MTNWSDEKIKLWEDSVKKVLFPQPVVASTTDTSITSAVRSKSNRVMAASTSNSYVPNYHSIDQTKAVGEIAISQSISPSGATTYAVPIDIYQSPNGFQPQLMLGYNSQGGNSSMGMGWNLGGASVITRVTQSQYYDGSTKGITMGKEDAFVLDGMRLLKTEETSTQIKYEAEQGNVKAIAYLNGSVVKYFDVFYPDGSKAIFGYTINNTSSLTYPIVNLSDRFNNSIFFNYSYAGGKYFLIQIMYGSSYSASIEFNYETSRPDNVITYQAGHKTVEDRLLSSIVCKYGSTTLRTYNFEYITQKNTSLLNKINCSAGSSSLNPLIFYYGENNTATGYINSQTQLLEWYVYNNPGQVQVEKGKFEYGTQNDGMIVNPYNEQYWYKRVDPSLFHSTLRQYINQYSGQEKIFLYSRIGSALAEPMPNLVTGTNFIKMFCANLDGKEEDEIVKINNGISGNNDQVVFTVYKPNIYSGFGLNYTRTFNLPTVLTDINGNKSIHPKFYFPGDFNGDGRMEVFAVSCNNPLENGQTSKCYLFDLETGTLLFDDYVFPYEVNFMGTKQNDMSDAAQKTDRLYVLDYDGDGKSDICLINNDGIKFFTFNITGSTYMLSQAGSTYTGLKKVDLNEKQLLLGEFNGDGKVDFLLTPKKTYSNWSFFYSMGNSQFEQSPYSLYRYSSDDSYFLQDVNSDGLTDLISMNSISFITYLSINGGFSLSSVVQHDNNNIIIIPTNVNNRNYFSQIVALRNDGIASLYSFPCNDSKERMLTGMINSLGVITKNYYSQLNEGAQYTYSGLYTPGYGAVYPYVNFQGGLTVTGKTELYHNGELTASNATCYVNAVIHQQGLGFNGFERITSFDLTRGRSSVQVFAPYNYGVQVSDDSPTASNTYNYTVSTQNNKRLSKLLSSVRSTDKLKGDTVTSSYTYDAYGNPTTEIVNYGGGISATTTNTYYNNSTYAVGNLIGFPTGKTVTINRKNSTWTTSTSVADYSNGLPKKTYEYVNSYLVSTVDYGYDGSWNLLNKTIKKYNSSKSFITSYEYDVYKRLTKETDPLGFYNTYHYDASNGRLTSTLNQKSQVTTYAYDDFGRSIGKAYPDGTSESSTLSWQPYSGGVNALYAVEATATGKPLTRTYYDALNRETRNKTIRFNDTFANVDKVYDGYGRLLKTSLPYISTPSVWVTNSYDSYDRVIAVSDGSGKTTGYAYSDNSVTTTTEGIASCRTYDTMGNLVLVVDAGGTITYNLRPDGQPATVVAPGSITTTLGYDEYGRQTSIDDPSAGLQTYHFDTDGNMDYEIDAESKRVDYSYDAYNRPKTTTYPEFSTTYDYNTDGLLKSELSTNGTKQELSYDSFGRVDTTKNTGVDGKWLKKAYTYLGGSVSTVAYSSQSGNITTESYSYVNGYLTEVKINGTTSIWSLAYENNLGQPTGVKTGGTYRFYEYDTYGLPTKRTVYGLQDFSYSIDAATGNLTSRTDNRRSIQESFGYDNLNRLTTYGGQTAGYSPNGNLINKPDIGSFDYATSGKPYAISTATPATNAIPLREQYVTYNSFKRPASITENGYAAVFTYNAAAKRVKMQVTQGGSSVLTRHYLGGQYELDETVGGTKEKLYLSGDAYSAPAVYVRSNGGAWQVYYIYRDYQGSITHITNSSGTLVQELSYDAWGRLRNPDTQVAYAPGAEPALFLGRGYTGHEHLQQFGLINMNARLYDPALGRFLSPDPYIQSPDFTQNFNRYSYVLNNPLKYTDENGEFISTIITAVVGLAEAVVRGVVVPWFVGFDDPSKAGKMFENAWKDYGKQMSNAWKIDMGLFKTDPNKSTGGQIWEIVSRFTWQLPQTLVGNLIMTGGNIAYQVDNVTYGYGVTAVDMGIYGGAITVGNYTAGPRGYTADWRDHMFVHEYGHYIQSQQHGPMYLFSVGIPSLQSAIMQKRGNPNSPQHNDRWFEADASYKGAAYFDKYYGSGKDGYVTGSANYFDRNSFIYGNSSPYLNPRRGISNYSKNPIAGKFHWTDIPIYIPLCGLIPAIFY